MVNTFAQFTLYEILRIIIPGAYFVLGLNKILVQFLVIRNIKTTDFEITFYFTVLSILIGILLYSLDIPKSFKFIKKELPTAVLSREFPNLNKNVIYISYFNFYDKLPSDFTYHTEKQSNFYHLCVNLAFINLILLLVTIISNILSPDIYFLMLEIIFLIVLVISFLGSYFSYVNYLKSLYQRAVAMFRNSDEYLKLKEQANSARNT